MEQKFDLESYIELWAEAWAEAWPMFVIVIIAGLFISGMATHKAAKWMGAGYSSFGRGVATVLLGWVASFALSIPYFFLFADDLLTPNYVVNIVYTLVGWLIGWLIIMGMFKVSFWRAIGISILSVIIAFFLGLLLLIPLFLLITAVMK